MADRQKVFKYQIFLTCDRTAEKSVKIFCKHLSTRHSLSVWFLPKDAKYPDRYKPEVVQAIKVSQLFIACINKDFTEDPTSIFQFNAALTRKMSGIFVQLDFTTPENCLRNFPNWPLFKVFENPDGKKWSGPIYDALMQQIEECLGLRLPKQVIQKDFTEKMFQKVQNSIEKGYEKKWTVLDTMKENNDEIFTVEIMQDGSLLVGSAKNSNFADHMGNFTKLNGRDMTDNQFFRNFKSLISFCMKHLSQASTTLKLHGTQFYKVIQGDPLSVHIQGAPEKTPVKDIITHYLKFISKALWMNLGTKCPNVILKCPNDYGMLEKADIKDCFERAGLSIRKILTRSVSEALALVEQLSPQDYNRKCVHIDWSSGPLSIIVFEKTGVDQLRILSQQIDKKFTSDRLRESLKSQLGMIDFSLADKNTLKVMNDLYEQLEKGLPEATMKTSRGDIRKIKTIEIETMIKPFIEQSSLLLREMLKDLRLDLKKDLKQITYTCFHLLSLSSKQMYHANFASDNLDRENYFRYENQIDTVHALTVFSNKMQQGKVKLIAETSNFNLGISSFPGIFEKILLRKSVLPVSETLVYGTILDNQKQLKLEIIAGERPLARNCDMLGDLVVQNLPNGKAGTVGIQVTFTLDENEALTVIAKETSSGQTLQTVIDKSKIVANADADQALIEAARFKKQDEKFLDAFNKLNTAIEKARDKYAKKDPNNVTSEMDALVNEISEISKDMTLEQCTLYTEKFNKF